MGREDEGVGSHINGSVSTLFCTPEVGKLNSSCILQNVDRFGHDAGRMVGTPWPGGR